jgi:hypothetical protein
VLGRPVDGIIGYDLIDQYVTEIDYDAQVLRLFNPRTYTYQGKGTPLPLVLSDRVPHVVVNIEVPGRPAESRTLLVDSGSNDAVDDSTVAHSSSVRRVLSGVGNGKEFQGIEGHISCFKLGNYTIKEFTGGGSGVPLIGGEVLRRFTVVFDYYHKRMFLEPNRHITEPVAEDRSGIAIRWDADKSVFLVHDISVGSPATRSGLKKGDMITAIDGCPSAAFRLDRVVRLLGEDHKSVTFTIRRQERDVSVTLTTGSLMPTSAKSH